jgi:hypothetical protein
MPVVIGLFFAFPGFVAALAGLTARSRVRRLRRTGRPAWAMVVPAPRDAGSPRRNLIQYPLDDGRVIERRCPGPARKKAAPSAGQKLRVWYDPADPADVLVNGWDGRYGDLAFLAVGLSFIVFGLALAFGR